MKITFFFLIAIALIAIEAVVNSIKNDLCLIYDEQSKATDALDKYPATAGIGLDTGLWYDISIL